jgi:hypothetical protein
MNKKVNLNYLELINIGDTLYSKIILKYLRQKKQTFVPLNYDNY